MKEKTLQEIDYLKHLQEHNMFNYNIKHHEYFSRVALTIAIFLGIFTLILPLFRDLVIFTLLIIILVLLLIILYQNFKLKTTSETRSFANYHIKIKNRYKSLGLDIDELGR